MTYRSDDEIKRDVTHQLGWDTRVRQTEIGVAVVKGVVTLTGTVDNYAKKFAAQETAHSVRGVHDVANDIEVKIPGSSYRTDAEIAQAVRSALEWDVLVPADQIFSTVTDGWVALEGKVEHYSERLDAERAVRNLAGVRGVTNTISVSTPVDPEKIKYLIEDILEVRADREAKHINVKVEDGEVTVIGAVNSWAEKKAIVGAIEHSPGVTAIRDHLYVAPYRL